MVDKIMAMQELLKEMLWKTKCQSKIIECFNAQYASTVQKLSCNRCPSYIAQYSSNM